MSVTDWRRNCAAIIPCANEAAGIGTIVTGLRPIVGGVVVVDDGSTDATAPIARNAGAEVLSLKTNFGKGAALRQGWELARKRGFSWVLMLDGDGQHAVADAPKFFDCAAASGAKLVVGNRMENARGMPWVRRCANRWMSGSLSRMTGVPLPDSQCGFRLAHLETLLNLPLRANRFEIESAMLVAFLAAGHRVEFVSIRTIYENGVSRINPLTDSWRWLRWRLAQRAALRACNPMRVP